MNKPVDRLYRICRPIADAKGHCTDKYEMFPSEWQKPYDTGQMFLALAEFCKLWKNIGIIPPRELEPFAIPENSDCAVIRISDIDPDFFLPDETIVITSMIASRQMNFLPVLEGAKHVGNQEKIRGVHRHPRQRGSK